MLLSRIAHLSSFPPGLCRSYKSINNRKFHHFHTENGFALRGRRNTWCINANSCAVTFYCLAFSLATKSIVRSEKNFAGETDKVTEWNREHEHESRVYTRTLRSSFLGANGGVHDERRINRVFWREIFPVREEILVSRRTDNLWQPVPIHTAGSWRIVWRKCT